MQLSDKNNRSVRLFRIKYRRGCNHFAVFRINATGGDNKLTVWAWDQTFNIKAMKLAGELYAKDHPGFEVMDFFTDFNKFRPGNIGQVFDRIACFFQDIRTIKACE